MRVLSLETACYGEASAALMKEDKVLAKKVWPLGREVSAELVPAVAEMTGGVPPDLIVVDRGPGSFTGIRTGIAAAQGLALGWGCELVGLPYFSYYPRVAEKGSELLLLNARAGGGFYYEYRTEKGCSAGYAKAEELPQKFPDCECYYGECDENTFPGAEYVPVKVERGAESLARLALEKRLKGEALPPEAIYLHLRANLPKKD